MPEDAEPQPVKRSPGRPRKIAAAAKVEAPADDAWKTPEPAAEPAKPADPRVGQECPAGWSAVGYSDGSSYRCENGKIVERVI
jgi:hypothetical protein